MLRVDGVLLPLAHFDLDVTFASQAKVTAIFGPSGAGKTSLLDAIAGLRALQRGRIVLDDTTLSDLPPQRRGIGYVPQENALFPHLTVEQNIRYGVHAELRAIDVLELAHLLPRRVTDLSGGEQKRVALARALAVQPRLLLLDEPLSGLDAPLKSRILELLQRIRDELAVPMVYVTHDQAEVEVMAGEVVFLERGRVHCRPS